MTHRLRWTLAVLLAAATILPAQDKKPPEKKDAPRVIVALPLGIPAGKTTKVTLRGLKLDAATEVRFPVVKATAKVVSKGKATVPNMQEAKHVGDTQIEVEVTLPADVPDGTAEFIVMTPAGESASHKLLVEKTIAVIAEKEPNNGFKQAQPITLPQAVDGAIGQNQDVDVFRFEGKAGQRVVIEVLAARYGSALDSFLSLHDADGKLLATCDDIEGSTDSRIEAMLPKDGAYFASIIDAHDTGGPAHVYRLVVKDKK
jgi:Bacterial pre-peptidase C-terminal domain